MRRRAVPVLAAGLLAAVGVLPAAARAQVRAVPAPPPSAFWHTFGDTALARLVEHALVANRDLGAAVARVDGRRAERTGAVLALTPSITATSGYSRQRPSSLVVPGATGALPDQSVWDAGVQFSWEVDLFGRLRRSVEARGALVDAAQEDVRAVQVVVAAEVANAYFALRGAQDQLAVARRNADNQRRTLQVTLDRLDGGRGTALDTERAQAQLSSTLAAIPSLEADVAAAAHRIDVLLGRPPGAGAEIGTAGVPLAALPDVDLPAGLEAIVRQRPDVRAAERQRAAQAAFADAARADYLPRLSIGGVAGTSSSALDRFGAGGTTRYAVGPVLSWPLFDLARVRAGVAAARAGEVEAAARHEGAVLRALEEVETAGVAYDRARERLRHLEDAAAASERATELARLRFEEGATGFLEVLDAERTQLEAQDRLALGRTQAAAALVAVYRALGGVWPDASD